MASAYWKNCDIEENDVEISEIDELEKLIPENMRKKSLEIRRLITKFEVCHHNSLRWAERILYSITNGVPAVLSGRKRSEHPISVALLALRKLLASITDEATSSFHHDDIPAIDIKRHSQWIGLLSNRQRWLTGLVLDNLEHHLHDAGLISAMRTPNNCMFPGGNIDIQNEEDARSYFRESFKYYLSYREETIHMVDELHPTEKENRLPLLMAIQFANPCSVNYFPYVSTLLDMIIGTKKNPHFPFPFCGHYLERQRSEFHRYVQVCQSFLNKDCLDTFIEEQLFDKADNNDFAKTWLFASFEKTLRLQLGE